MVKHFSDKYFSGNQIKFILILISSFIMIYGCKSPEPKKSERTEKSTPENFQVQAKKEANYSSNSSSTFFVLPHGRSFRAPIHPNINGIPDSLNEIKKYFIPVNWTQAVFQAYKAGLVDDDYVKRRLKKNVKDTTQCTKNNVKVFITIVTGKSKNGNKYSILDSNNDYDLSNDSVILLNQESFSKQPKKVLFENFVKGKVIKDSTWMDFFMSERDVLRLRICEQVSASIMMDSLNYTLIAYPKESFNIGNYDNVIFEITETSSKKKQSCETNQYAFLDNNYYRVYASSDGQSVSFELDTNAVLKGSAQINMPAIPFETVSVNKDTIRFPKDYRGKYVFLDFWATTCPPCIKDIREKYIKLYEQYGGEKFEIIGIGDDPENRIKEFTMQNNIPWIMISDSKRKIQESYRVKFFPGLYLINPEGIIIAKGNELKKDKLELILKKCLMEL
jgi:peroxiredoxin